MSKASVPAITGRFPVSRQVERAGAGIAIQRDLGVFETDALRSSRNLALMLTDADLGAVQYVGMRPFDHPQQRRRGETGISLEIGVVG